MTRRAAHRSTGESGFTLIELLVAMTLSGLLLATLAAGLRFVSNSWERGAELTALHEELALAQRHLRGELGQLQWLHFGEGDRREAAFEGESDTLRFVIAGGRGPLAPGLYAVELSLERAAGGGQRLVRRQAPFPAGTEDFGDLDFEDEVVLAEGLTGLRFNYLGVDEQDDWANAWRGEDRLPSLLRLAPRGGNAEGRSDFPSLSVALGGQMPLDCFREDPVPACPKIARLLKPDEAPEDDPARLTLPVEAAGERR